MATFHILNFGCRASQADGAALKQQLLQSGFQEGASVDNSAVAILNTCTVTATADAEVRQFVRRIHRRNPQCRILVTGCYAQRAPQELAQMEGVAWVVGNSHKHLVGRIVSESRDREIGRSGDREIGGSGDRVNKELHSPGEFPIQPTHPSWDQPITSSLQPAAAPLVQIKAAGLQLPDLPITQSPDHPIPPNSDPVFSQSPAPSPQPLAPDFGLRTSDFGQIFVGEITEEFHFAPVFADDRTRPTLKIQDGCDARCAFCIIPSVRGHSRSLPPETVLDQVRELAGAGYQEIVLSGINLGGYGRDLDRRINFLGMLERILRETPIARIRISSIEPMDVSPSLIRLVAQEPRLAQHFHVPLQSGCDRILRAMNRRYWVRQYAERIQAVREQIPHSAIGADVMVGFPGETGQDHAASLRFIESLPYTYLHVFPFSARPGTPAATAAGQVNGRVARERSQEVRAVIAAKRDAFLAAQVGQCLPALTLDEAENGGRVALTTNYLRVVLPGEDIPPNRLVDIWIGRISAGKLYGYTRGAGAPTSKS